MSDTNVDLGSGYTYLHEGKNYNYITGKNNSILPNVIDYVYNDEYILVCQKPEKMYYTNLLSINLYNDYCVYDSFIKDSISKKYYKSRNQILNDSIIYKIFKTKNVTLDNTIDDINKSIMITDSIISNDNKQRKIFSLEKVYWIIHKKENTLLGPFSLVEYLQKKQSLKINNNLKLLKY